MLPIMLAGATQSVGGDGVGVAVGSTAAAPGTTCLTAVAWLGDRWLLRKALGTPVPNQAMSARTMPAAIPATASARADLLGETSDISDDMLTLLLAAGRSLTTIDGG